MKINILSVLLLFFLLGSATAETYQVKGQGFIIVPIHGPPINVDVISIGSGDVIQYISPKRGEGFISKSNVKNINELKFLIEGIKKGLGKENMDKARSLGVTVDELDREIIKEEQNLQETLTSMRLKARSGK